MEPPLRHHFDAPTDPSCSPTQRDKPSALLDRSRKTDGSKKPPRVRTHGVAVFGQARPRAREGGGGGGRDALEGKAPRRRPQERLGRRLEEVAEAVGGGYCRLRMPLRLGLGVRGAVAGHGLGSMEGPGGNLPPFQCIPWWGGGGYILRRVCPRRPECQRMFGAKGIVESHAKLHSGTATARFRCPLQCTCLKAGDTPLHWRSLQLPSAPPV